jgi:hypothetical protein
MRLGLLIGLMGLSSSAWAQEPGRGTTGRVVVGVASHQGIFGDESPRSTREMALTIGAQAWKKLSGPKAFVFEVIVPMSLLDNPNLDEDVGAAYFQVGTEFGSRLYVRPSGGVTLRFWSGSQAESGIDLAPTVGVSIGHRRNVGSKLQISPEVFARAGFTVGALTSVVGVQMAIGPRR